jgi:hypothetical protein
MPDPIANVRGGPWTVKGCESFTRDDLRNLYHAIARSPQGHGAGFVRGTKRWARATSLLRNAGLVRYRAGFGWEVTNG